jgi:hypothetical protein
MARLRLLLVAVFILVMVGCPLLQQQENFISFTFDGVHYLFTAGAVEYGHPHAIGYYWLPGDPIGDYVIQGSATAAGAAAIPNPKDTLVIYMTNDGDWYLSARFYDSDGWSTDFYLPRVPEGMIETFVANRDAVGEQFAGSLPGPFYGVETPALEDIIFSVERLPDEQAIIN